MGVVNRGSSRMDVMMKRLKVIYDDCVPEEKKEVKSDEFTKLKKKIAQEIRDIREVFFFSSASCLPPHHVLPPLLHYAPM